MIPGFITSSLFLGISSYALGREAKHLEHTLDAVRGLTALYPIIVIPDILFTALLPKLEGHCSTSTRLDLLDSGFIGRYKECDLYTSAFLYPTGQNKYTNAIFGIILDSNRITIDRYYW